MPRKKSTSKASAKKPKLENLAQADGRDDSKQETVIESKARTLSQVWGDDGLWKYNTMDSDEYNVQLDEMNKSDLQAHAQSVGLIPIDDVVLLRKRLKNEFKSHVAKYKNIDQPKQTTDISKEAMNILKEGR